MKLLVKFTTLCLICLMTLSAFSTEATDMEYEGSFKQIKDPKAFIANEFSKAKAENKKVLFVLGGNWCHDSRSIAKKLDDAVLATTIKNNYRLSLIDVGYLNQAFEFTEKADMKTFYATPTVLIFDPETERLINSSDMHIWSQAFNLTQEDAEAYFSNYTSVSVTKSMNAKLSDSQQTALNQLNKFTLQQEDRILAGYKIIGPMLKRYKDDDVDENFGSYWKALAGLRMNLPTDVQKVREQIVASVDTEINKIVFPSYEELPWE